MKNLKLLSKKELQNELQQRGLSKSGNKATLVERLQDGFKSNSLPECPQQCADYEVIELQIIDSPEQCSNDINIEMNMNFIEFKKYVFTELASLREEVVLMKSVIAEKDDEIKRLKPSSSDKSTNTPPWPWQSPCNASTRELATHREIPSLALVNRFEALRSLPHEKWPASDATPGDATNVPVVDSPIKAASDKQKKASDTTPSVPRRNRRLPDIPDNTGTPRRQLVDTPIQAVSDDARSTKQTKALNATPSAPQTRVPKNSALVAPALVAPALAAPPPMAPAPDQRARNNAALESTPVATTVDTPVRARPGNAAPSSPVVPGLRTYSDVAYDQTTTLILTDSMMNGVRQDEIDLNIGCKERAIVKKFGGATARELESYADYNIERYRPKQLVVVVGTNDLTQQCRDGFRNRAEPNPEEIADDILRIGRRARDKGIENIYIASIILRHWSKYRDLRKNVNIILHRKCHIEGFYFIDNDNIMSKHLAADGLHLNPVGSRYLKQNILRCCFSTFNPYLCDFNFYYDYSGDRGFQLNGRLG